LIHDFLIIKQTLIVLTLLLAVFEDVEDERAPLAAAAADGFDVL
jgi:hypothetical protein